MVEYILSLPSSNKIKNEITKYILRNKLKGLVPDEILERKDKIGFATPDKEVAYSEEVQEFIWDIINSKSFKNRKYWDWRKIQKTYKKRKSNRLFVGENIWRVIIIELWLRVFIDNEYKMVEIT